MEKQPKPINFFDRRSKTIFCTICKIYVIINKKR